MPAVLTNGSSISCATQGKVTPASTAKLKVSGNSVLLKTDVSSWAVAGCKKNPPCATVAPPTLGVSTKLTVGGTAVLLATLTAQGSGGDPVTAIANQTKLSAS